MVEKWKMENEVSGKDYTEIRNTITQRLLPHRQTLIFAKNPWIILGVSLMYSNVTYILGLPFTLKTKVPIRGFQYVENHPLQSCNKVDEGFSFSTFRKYRSLTCGIKFSYLPPCS